MKNQLGSAKRLKVETHVHVHVYSSNYTYMYIRTNIHACSRDTVYYVYTCTLMYIAVKTMLLVTLLKIFWCATNYLSVIKVKHILI